MSIVPATSLPKDKDGKRYDPDGVMAEGHVHNMVKQDDKALSRLPMGGMAGGRRTSGDKALRYRETG